MDTGLMTPVNSEKQLSDEQSRAVAALVFPGKEWRLNRALRSDDDVAEARELVRCPL